MIKLSRFANDLTGQRIGKLLVEYPVRRTPKSLNVVWFCRCDCGGSIERVGSLLRAERGLQHCGCERARPALPASTRVALQEKAYFAGYTDAEGCIGIATFTRKASRYWYAYVYFGQTRPMVVERLHAVYGGMTTVRKRDHRRRQKELRLQAINEVRQFLTDVLPQLREKRNQAEIVLNQFDPKAAHTINQTLMEHLSHLKEKRLEHVVIEPRLAIASQARLKCHDCGEGAVSRGFCARHYVKARREGRFTTNPKGAGVPFTYGRVLREFDAPYFAGYFDGDGCIAIASEKKCWYPRITFSQTQADTLIELHAVYGGSLRPEKARSKRRRPKLNYQLVQREAVYAFLHDIRPFVVEKRDQVELFLTRYRAGMPFDEGKRLKKQLSVMKRQTFSEPSDPLVKVNA